MIGAAFIPSDASEFYIKARDRIHFILTFPHGTPDGPNINLCYHAGVP